MLPSPFFFNFDTQTTRSVNVVRVQLCKNALSCIFRTAVAVAGTDIERSLSQLYKLSGPVYIYTGAELRRNKKIFLSCINKCFTLP